MLIPTGFWSYTTSDESNARGKLSQLRALLAAELQQQVGREPKVNIFQDVVAIPPGAEWDAQIRKAIGDSSFVIPIITPGFLQSEWCCREVTLFQQREAELGVKNLVFPLHYVGVDHITGGDPHQCHDPDVLAFLRTRQWTDFRPLRLRNQEGEEVAILLEGLAQWILRALREAAVARDRATTKPRLDADERRRDAAAEVAHERPTRKNDAEPQDHGRGPGETSTRDFAGAPRLVSVPPGRFAMGSPATERGRDASEGPAHDVQLHRGFAIGKFAVTFAEWAIARAEGGVDHDPDPRMMNLENQPVTGVSWEDASKYCLWLSERSGRVYRLPTETEWEYAARAGTTSSFWWGERSSTNDANYDGFRHRSVPVDFAGFQPNPWGLHQMLGNTWEWCEDNWFPNHEGAPTDGAARRLPPRQPGEGSALPTARGRFQSIIATRRSSDEVRAPLRVVRGGSWTLPAKDIRSARRAYYMQNYRGDTIGFRVVREL